MDINLSKLIEDDAAAISHTLIYKGGWERDHRSLTKVIQDVPVELSMRVRLLTYKMYFSSPNVDVGLNKTVCVPWIEVIVMNGEVTERLLFALKNSILDVGLRPFKDDDELLEMFTLRDGKYCFYLNPDYPDGWSDKRTLSST